MASESAGGQEGIFLGLQGLTIGYGQREVLRDVDLTLRQGEILTLVGPNGAGKSTLIRTLCGQLAPLGGRIYMGGSYMGTPERGDSGTAKGKGDGSASLRDLTSMSTMEIARSAAVVFTEQVRPEHMTCREVVEAGRYPYTGAMGKLRPKDHIAVDRSMKRMHVEDLAERRFDAISDGQRQRVLIARAMAQDTPILMLDEPTSYLDIRYKAELMDALRELSAEGHAVLMSLHEVDLALEVSDRILCVREGQRPFCGTPRQVLESHVLRELFGLTEEMYDKYFGRAAAESAASGRMFTNRKCPYFPCHKTESALEREQFNCLFCYCPLYGLGKSCGGNFRITEKGVKDCTPCMYPHRAENYGEIIERLRALNRKDN